MSDRLTFESGFVPPLPIGTRVIATETCTIARPGTTGTITWHHPFPDMPYRVKWDLPPRRFEFGMSDIGDLTKPHEIVEQDTAAT